MMDTATVNIRKIFAFLLLLLLLLLITSSFNRMIGSFYEFLVTKHLNFWAEQEELPSSVDLDTITAFYQKAVSRTPNSPDLLQAGGMLAEWYAYINQDDEINSKQYYDLALKRYRASTDQRPTWPYTWFNIVEVKLTLAEIDEEFLTAFSNAITLGPNEPDIQLGIVQIGLITWEILDKSTQNTVMSIFYTMLVQRPHVLFKTVDENGLAARLKLILDDSDDEYFIGFSKSLELALNEPDTQVGSIQIGLMTWETLDKPLKNRVITTVYTALAERQWALFEAVEEYGQLEFLCDFPINNQLFFKKCSSL